MSTGELSGVQENADTKPTEKIHEGFFAIQPEYETLVGKAGSTTNLDIEPFAVESTDQIKLRQLYLSILKLLNYDINTTGKIENGIILNGQSSIDNLDPKIFIEGSESLEITREAMGRKSIINPDSEKLLIAGFPNLMITVTRNEGNELNYRLNLIMTAQRVDGGINKEEFSDKDPTILSKINVEGQVNYGNEILSLGHELLLEMARNDAKGK